MIEFIKTTFNTLLANPVVAGMIGGSAIISVFWAIFRSIPNRIKSIFWGYFTVSVTVEDREYTEKRVFHTIQDWLEVNLPKKRLLNIRVIGTNSEGEGRYVPSPTSMYFRYNKRWFIVTKSREVKQSGDPQESVTIRTYGRNTQILKDFISHMLPHPEPNPLNRVVSIHAGAASEAFWRVLRPLDTIILPEIQKERIINNIRSFVDNEKWYTDRALTYQTGFLFYGAPGTGKTSTAMALAGAVSNYNIQVFSLGSYSKEEDFITHWCKRPQDSKDICIFEDVDTIAGAISRESQDKGDAVSSASASDGKPIGLGTLLGMLDGTIGYRHGTIIVLTTNFSDRLDKALIRPGRIDHHEHIELFGYNEVLRMCKLFLKDEVSAEAFAKTISLPISPAQLQVDLVIELKRLMFKNRAEVTIDVADVKYPTLISVPKKQPIEELAIN